MNRFVYALDEPHVVSATVESVADPKLRKYVGKTVEEIAKAENKHPVEAMLDIAVADNLQTEFETPARNLREAEPELEKLVRSGYTTLVTWPGRGGGERAARDEAGG